MLKVLGTKWRFVKLAMVLQSQFETSAYSLSLRKVSPSYPMSHKFFKAIRQMTGDF